MALVACRECGKEVSQNAKSCPSCGAPLPALKNLKLVQIVFAVVFGAVLLFFLQIFGIAHLEVFFPKSSSTSSDGDKPSATYSFSAPSWCRSEEGDEWTGTRCIWRGSK